jgi:hypothetical protein
VPDLIPSSRRAVAALLAAVGWFALILQLGIMLRNAATAGTGLLAAVESFLSFFTILSNLLVAAGLVATIPAAPPRTLRPLIEPPGATALAVYVTVVGAVYSLVLRQLWHPTGAQRAADILLHDVMPPAYVIYWLALVPKGRLQWRQVWPWLAFPVGYVAATSSGASSFTCIPIRLSTSPRWATSGCSATWLCSAPASLSWA